MEHEVGARGLSACSTLCAVRFGMGRWRLCSMEGWIYLWITQFGHLLNCVLHKLCMFGQRLNPPNPTRVRYQVKNRCTLWVSETDRHISYRLML